MKRRQTGNKRTLIIVTLSLMMMVSFNNLHAQDIFGISAGEEYYPGAEIKNVPEGAPGFKMRTRAQNLKAAFPLMFNDGKILVKNHINYKRFSIDYRNSPVQNPDIGHCHALSYTAFFQDSLSPRWNMVAILTPGIASDFEGDFSRNEITFSGVFGFVRKHSKQFQLGYGVAYTHNFGNPIPMPFLYYNWNNGGKLFSEGILPTNAGLYYGLHKRVDVGALFAIGSARYHGDPDKFGVGNPQIEITEGTVSQLTRIHLTNWVHMDLEGGYAAYRKVQFLDGNDKHDSYRLEPSAYARTRLVLGI
ncbi:DUF6268 family outer membrane beta-barrel protein [Fibrobacterota bacterium]